MKKIIIGVVARANKINNKDFIGTYDNYLKMIIKCGGIPIIIKPYDYDNLIYLLNLCDGILSPGGDDYDNYDLFIYDYCIKKDIPYLGICLGFQTMSGELVNVNNHYNTYHKIYLNKKSKLYKIYNKETLLVNSRHHQKIVKTNDFISSKAEDDTIESIEVLNKKFIVGVQWHPEDLNDELLFNEFIKNCL